MAETFQQVIEVALRATQDPNLRALLEQLRDLGDQGELTDDQLSQVTDALQNFNATAAQASGLQQSITALENFRAEQDRVGEAVDKAALKLKLASEQEAASAAALAQSKTALEQVRAEREKYLASEERTAEGTREFAQALKDAKDATRAAQTEYAESSATLRQASTEYERAAGAKDKLTAGIEKNEAAIKGAGLSVDDLGEAQAELQRRMAETAASTDALAQNVRESVAANQQAAAAAKQNAAATKALADANATLGRRSFAEVRAEIDKVREAYDTLRRSGTLSVQELSQAQSRAIERTRELRAEYGSLGNSLRQVQGSLLAAGAGLFTATRLLTTATTKAIEFGTAMGEVSTLLDDTSGLDGLTESVEQLAQDFGRPIEQAQALYQVISAGATDAAEANRILEQSNKLAIAGVSNLKTSADGLTSSLNAYGKTAADAERFSDTLFAGVRAGKTTVDELAGAIGNVAPIAATAEVSFEELVATIATLTQGGVATTQAVTQIRGVLASVIKPTADAKKAAEELGIEFDLAALRSQGLAGFLRNIAERAGDNEEALSRLFGSVEGLQAVFALVGAQAGNFERNLESVANAAGATQTAFDKLNDQPAQRLVRFNASLELLQNSFGNAVASLSPLLEGLTSLVNAFNELPAGLRTSVAGVTALAAVIAPLAIAFVQSRAALVLLLGSLRGIGPAAAAAAAGVGTFTTAANTGTAAATRLSGSLGVLARAFAVVAAAQAGWEIGSALNDPITRFRLSVDDAAKSTVEFAFDIDEVGRAGQEAADKFANFQDVAVKTSEDVQRLGEQQREAYRVALEGLNNYLKGRITELAVRQRSKKLSEEEQEELQRLFGRLDEVRKGFVDLDSAALGAARSISEVATGGASNAVKQLAGQLLEAADDSKKLGEELGKVFKGADFDGGLVALSEIALAIDTAAASSTAAGDAIREGLAKELANLSGEDLLRLQQGAQLAFASVGESATGASTVLDTIFAESVRRLGVNVEAAGLKVTEQGRQIIAAFRAIAENSKSSAATIGAAFNAAINRAQTTAEVQELEQQLRNAFNTGRISAQQLGLAISAAAARTAEIKTGALEAQGALGDIGTAGRQMARDLIATLQAARGTLATEADAIARAIAKALSEGKPTDALREQLAGVEAQIQGTNTQIEGLEKGLAGIGDESDRTANRSNESFNKLRDGLKDAALQAKDTAAAVGSIGQQGQQAGEEVELGVSNALLGLIEYTKQARSTVEELGPAAVEAFERLRGELGVVDTTGRSTADVMQLIADRAANAAKAAEELKLQIGDTEERVKRTREEMARLAQQTQEASNELADLNRQLQDDADRRAGNEEAIRRREYEEQLRRIAELERQGGASAAIQAAQARQLARANFEADLREIREREREQLDSDRRVDSERNRRRSGGTGSAGAGLVTTGPRTVLREIPPVVININAEQFGNVEDLARKLSPQLDRLQRNGFNPRIGA